MAGHSNGITAITVNKSGSLKLACQRLAELDLRGLTTPDVLVLPMLRGLPSNQRQAQ